jgi:hypothetical protein
LEKKGEAKDAKAGLRCIHTGTVFLRQTRRF